MDDLSTEQLPNGHILDEIESTSQDVLPIIGSTNTGTTEPSNELPPPVVQPTFEGPNGRKLCRNSTMPRKLDLPSLPSEFTLTGQCSFFDVINMLPMPTTAMFSQHTGDAYLDENSQLKNTVGDVLFSGSVEPGIAAEAATSHNACKYARRVNQNIPLRRLRTALPHDIKFKNKTDADGGITVVTDPVTKQINQKMFEIQKAERQRQNKSIDIKNPIKVFHEKLTKRKPPTVPKKEAAPVSPNQPPKIAPRQPLENSIAATSSYTGTNNAGMYPGNNKPTLTHKKPDKKQPKKPNKNNKVKIENVVNDVLADSEAHDTPGSTPNSTPIKNSVKSEQHDGHLVPATLKVNRNLDPNQKIIKNIQRTQKNKPVRLNYARVQFEEDQEELIVNDTKDIWRWNKETTERAKIDDLADLKIHDTVIAKWPANQRWYMATVVDPLGTRNNKKKSGKNKSGAMPMSQSVNIDGTTFVQDDSVEISDLGGQMLNCVEKG